MLYLIYTHIIIINNCYSWLLVNESNYWTNSADNMF